MKSEQANLPLCVAIVGVDGSGKTTLARWLEVLLAERGLKSEIVWSRFMNYSSKPLLALTRLTGHNRYVVRDGVRFGYHDFENLIIYRELFAVLQAIDVNIATWSRIRRRCGGEGVVVCERCAWDTLVDVVADTGLEWLPRSCLGRAYLLMLPKDTLTIYVSRTHANILRCRPELVHDGKLGLRIDLYDELAVLECWKIVDNNGSIDATQDQIRAIFGL